MKPKPTKPDVAPAEKIPAAAIDKILRLLITLQDESKIRAAMASPNAGLELREDRLDAAIAAARRRLTIVADYHRDEEVGKAIARLNDLYERAVTVQDTKTALQAVRETNRLLALYPNRYDIATPDQPAEGDGATDAALTPPTTHPRAEAQPVGYDDLIDAIDTYLEPLALTDSVDDTDADVLRLAAEEIQSLRSRLARPKRRKSEARNPKSKKKKAKKKTAKKSRRRHAECAEKKGK